MGDFAVVSSTPEIQLMFEKRFVAFLQVNVDKNLSPYAFDERPGFALNWPTGDPMPLSNLYDTHPFEVNDSTILACVITFHVGYIHNGYPMVRAYRCRYPYPLLSNDDDIPQGDAIPWEHVAALMQALAPLFVDAGAEPDKS